LIFAVLIISDVTAMNLRHCLYKNTCSGDGESTVLGFITATKPQYHN